MPPKYDGTVESVTLKCRACGSGNRFPVERALADLAAVKCGRCLVPLLRVSGEPLTNVRAEDLAHPWDREALKALKAIPYAEKVVSTVFAATLDKLARFQMLAGAVRIDEKQAPRLWRSYLEAAGRVDVDPPPLFIVQDPGMNAFAMGAGAPMVGVTSGLLDGMGEREITGVLGHELTHVKLGHVLYRTIAILVINGGLAILQRLLGIAGALLAPLQVALTRWYQMSELSADRGELLTTGSLETFVRTHMLLSGGNSRYLEEMDVAAFIDQANEAEQLRDGDLLLQITEMFNNNRRTHPLPAWRVHHGMAWARTEPFFKLLAGEVSPRLTVDAA